MGERFNYMMTCFLIVFGLLSMNQTIAQATGSGVASENTQTKEKEESEVPIKRNFKAITLKDATDLYESNKLQSPVSVLKGTAISYSVKKSSNEDYY